MNTMQQNRASASSMWEDAYAAPRELVQEYPASATFLAFGVGIGVGMLIGQALSDSFKEQKPKYSKAEEFGRQMLDALKGTLPESVARHLPM